MKKLLCIINVFCVFLTVTLCFAESQNKPAFPETKVIIPYSLNIPFTLNQNHKVYIPAKDYFRLRFLAEHPHSNAEVVELDNEYDITSFFAKGMIENDKIKFKAHLDIFVNVDKWILISLPFQNIYIESLKLDNQDVPVKPRYKYTYNCRNQNASYQLAEALQTDSQQLNCRSFSGFEETVFDIPVLQKGHHRIDLSFYVEIVSIPGKKSIDFRFPETLCSELKIQSKANDIIFDVQSPLNGYSIDKTQSGCEISFATSHKNHIRLNWHPKRFLKESEKPLIYATCELKQTVDYDFSTLSQTLNLRIEKSALRSISFQKHPKLEILEINSNKVKNWKIKTQNDHEILELFFKETVTDDIQIEFLAQYQFLPGNTVPLLFIKPEILERMQGSLFLFKKNDFDMTITDLKNLTPAEMNARMMNDSSNSDAKLYKKYSFYSADIKAQIQSSPSDSKTSAKIFNHYSVKDNSITYDMHIHLDIKKGSISEIKLKYPEGYSLKSHSVSNISDPLIDQDQRIITFPFIKAIQNKHIFKLKFEKHVFSFDEILVQGVLFFNIDKIKGKTLISFPSEYEVQEKKIHVLESISLKNLKDFFQNHASDTTDYAYQYKDSSFHALFSLKKRIPVVDIIRINFLKVRDHLVEVKLLVLFQIKNAPTDHFLIEAPFALKDSIKVNGEGIKTILKKPDVKNKKTLLDVYTLTKMKKSYMLEISFDQYFTKEKTFELPPVVFPGSQNQIDFITVETDTAYQIQSFPVGKIREIEKDQIPAFPMGVKMRNIYWTYQCGKKNEWEYRLKLERLEREKMVEAKILRQDIKSCIIAQGIALHEINLKVQNKTLQFLPVRFPSHTKIWSVLVSEESVRPARLSSNTDNLDCLLIPIEKRALGERNVKIRILFCSEFSEFSGGGTLNLPMMNIEKIPIEKTTWTFYLPENYNYMNFEHNMNEVDVTVIETDKTVELAKEYAYWTNMAQTSSNQELQKNAIRNRDEVFSEYDSQQAITQSMQADISRRIKSGVGKQSKQILSQVEDENALLLSKATEIMRFNKKISTNTINSRKKQDKGQINGRTQVQGWQFKTNDFKGQNEIQESLNNFISGEQSKKIRLEKSRQKRQRQEKPLSLFGGVKKSKTYSKLRKKMKGNYQNAKAPYSGKVLEIQKREEEKKESLFEESESAQLNTDSELLDQIDFKLVSPQQVLFPQKIMAGDGKIHDPGGADFDDLSVLQEENVSSASSWEKDETGIDSDLRIKNKEIRPLAPGINQPSTQILIQSSLLRGMRSMNIMIPKQTVTYSFQKLGGNPEIQFTYYKKTWIRKILFFVLIFVFVSIIIRFRNLSFSNQKIVHLIQSEKLNDYYFLVMQSWWIKIIPTFLMFSCIFFRFDVGILLFVAGWGLNTILILKALSLKRYRKKGFIPPYHYRTFLKYCFSYGILLSLPLVLINRNYVFITAFLTVLNTLWIMLYAISIFFTKEVIVEKIRHVENQNDDKD